MGEKAIIRGLINKNIENEDSNLQTFGEKETMKIILDVSLNTSRPL